MTVGGANLHFNSNKLHSLNGITVVPLELIPELVDMSIVYCQILLEFQVCPDCFQGHLIPTS